MSDNIDSYAASPPPPPPELDNLITELRASLASTQTLLATQATRLSTLTDTETALAQLKDQYAFVSAAKDAVEKQLHEEEMKREVAEEMVENLREQVEALRGQVDQARKGVGLLQKQSEKERKRYSQLGGVGTAGLGLVQVQAPAPDGDEGIGMGMGLGTPPVPEKSVKRASMIKVGRAPSGDGEGLGPTPMQAAQATLSPPPAMGTVRGGLRELRLGTTATATTPPTITSPIMPAAAIAEDRPKTRRLSTSSSYAQTSPPPPPPDLPPKNPAAAASDEVAKLRAELAAAQRRLDESEEARLASESCLKALREFVAAGSGGDGSSVDLTDKSAAEALKGISLPPLPTDKVDDEEEELAPAPTRPAPSPRKGSAWNFKLWRQPSTSAASPAPSTGVEPPMTPQPLLSPPASNRHSTPRASPSPLATPLELDEAVVHSLPPQETPKSKFVSSWTKSVAPATVGAGAGGGSAQYASLPPTPAAAAASIPAPPNTTRKLSSFFGIGRRDEPVKEVHDFDAADAFTPQPGNQDRLEPSLMLDTGEGAGETEVHADAEGLRRLNEFGFDFEGAGSRSQSRSRSRNRSEGQPTPQTMTTALEEEEVETPFLSPRSQMPETLPEAGAGLKGLGVEERLEHEGGVEV